MQVQNSVIEPYQPSLLVALENILLKNSFVLINDRFFTLFFGLVDDKFRQCHNKNSSFEYALQTLIPLRMAVIYSKLRQCRLAFLAWRQQKNQQINQVLQQPIVSTDQESELALIHKEISLSTTRNNKILSKFFLIWFTAYKKLQKMDLSLASNSLLQKKKKYFTIIRLKLHILHVRQERDKELHKQLMQQQEKMKEDEQQKIQAMSLHRTSVKEAKIHVLEIENRDRIKRTALMAMLASIRQQRTASQICIQKQEEHKTLRTFKRLNVKNKTLQLLCFKTTQKQNLKLCSNVLKIAPTLTQAKRDYLVLRQKKLRKIFNSIRFGAMDKAEDQTLQRTVETHISQTKAITAMKQRSTELLQKAKTYELIRNTRIKIRILRDWRVEAKDTRILRDQSEISCFRVLHTTFQRWRDRAAVEFMHKQFQLRPNIKALMVKFLQPLKPQFISRQVCLMHYFQRIMENAIINAKDVQAADAMYNVNIRTIAVSALSAWRHGAQHYLKVYRFQNSVNTNLVANCFRNWRKTSSTEHRAGLFQRKSNLAIELKTFRQMQILAKESKITFVTRAIGDPELAQFIQQRAGSPMEQILREAAESGQFDEKQLRLLRDLIECGSVDIERVNTALETELNYNKMRPRMLIGKLFHNLIVKSKTNNVMAQRIGEQQLTMLQQCGMNAMVDKIVLVEFEAIVQKKHEPVVNRLVIRQLQQRLRQVHRCSNDHQIAVERKTFKSIRKTFIGRCEAMKVEKIASDYWSQNIKCKIIRILRQKLSGIQESDCELVKIAATKVIRTLKMKLQSLNKNLNDKTYIKELISAAKKLKQKEDNIGQMKRQKLTSLAFRVIYQAGKETINSIQVLKPILDRYIPKMQQKIAFRALKNMQAEGKLINYQQRLKMKQALRKWAEIARLNAIERHLEAKAERWDRRKLLVKTLMIMALEAGLDLEIGWQ